MTPVPGSAAALLGLHNLRGEILAAARPGALLGIAGDGGPRHLVVVADGERRAGLAVDDVFDFSRLPEATATVGSPFLLGGVLVDGALVGVVDVSAVLQSSPARLRRRSHDRGTRCAPRRLPRGGGRTDRADRRLPARDRGRESAARRGRHAVPARPFAQGRRGHGRLHRGQRNRPRDRGRARAGACAGLARARARRLAPARHRRPSPGRERRAGWAQRTTPLCRRTVPPPSHRTVPPPCRRTAPPSSHRTVPPRCRANGAARAGAGARTEPSSSVRLATEKVDRMLDTVGEAVVQHRRLEHLIGPARRSSPTNASKRRSIARSACSASSRMPRSRCGCCP